VLEERICAKDGGAITEVQRVELQKLRRGNWSMLKLKALLNLTDNGTKAAPLKSFTGSKAGEDFRAAMQFGSHALIILRPCDAADAVPFITAVADKVAPLFGTLPLDAINKWWIALTQHMSKGAEEFTVGDTSASSSALFDLAWINAPHPANADLNEAKLEAKAEALKKRKGGKADEDDNPTKRNKKDDKNKNKDKDNKGAGGDKAERAAGIKAGNKVPPPAKGVNTGPDKDKWAAFHDAHPAIGDKSACWHFNHPQGCARGDKCQFHHGK
jgi:hypothetical protein